MSSTRWRTALPLAGQALVMMSLGAVAIVLFRWHGIEVPRVDVASERITMSVGAAAAYLVFCLYFVVRTSRRASSQTRSATGTGAVLGDEVLVIHASQTGHAEALATKTAEALAGGGVTRVRSLALGSVDAALLAGASRALFVVSTTGEGDPPDDAYAFVRDTMQRAASLPRLQFGLLALGDSAYDSFCGFGRALDHWLRAQGASPLFDTVEVDDGDEGALRHWQHQLTLLGGSGDAADWSPPAYEAWRIVQRRVLNAGSPGAPAAHVRIEPQTPGAEWAAGDIVEVLPGPAGSDRPHREYSIASVPVDGAIDLLVREVRHPDGTPGLGSGWLTEQCPVGDTLWLRVRRNASFHAPDDDRPMILIGNGTGIAGLRAHLKQRVAQGRHRNWLMFGERTRAHDLHFGEELETWLAKGELSRLDLAFSRDESKGRYVQHLVADSAATMREWIAQGAAIYVCGSLQGMAPGVDAALVTALGVEEVEQLRIEGRYRRDVY
jgi:sulfite reductase (NADPH) flavoprotein alpha-component